MSHKYLALGKEFLISSLKITILFREIFPPVYYASIFATVSVVLGKMGCPRDSLAWW